MADTVRTGKRSLQFFRGGSKFKVNIGKCDIEKKAKNCLFFQFFFNGKPDLCQDVWFLYVFSRP